MKKASTSNEKRGPVNGHLIVRQSFDQALDVY